MKTLLGFALSGLAAVWIGCSSDSSPVSPSASKALTDTTAVSIPDANLRREIALLGSPVYDATIPITEAEMLRLTVLKASGKGIRSLVGLEHATNLDTLILASNKIRDVAPLAGLTGLKWLDLQRNGRIRDVTPLAGLINLEALHLYQQGGGFELSPLNGLTKLKRFGIGDGEFRGKVGPLVANMPDLEWLKVNGTNIGNLDFLVGLTKLEWLNISANGTITDFKPLTCLPSLETLIVRRLPRLLETNEVGAQVFNKHIQYLMDNDVTVIHAYNP